MTDAVLPDPRRVRRAVRWGVIRTAGGAVGWVVGGLVLLALIGMVYDSALGRRERFESVVGMAFVASQPDYAWTLATPSSATPPWYGSDMDVYGRLRGVDEDRAPATTKRLYQSAWGHLGRTYAFPEGPVTTALRRGRPTPSQTSALLAELPVHSRAVAIVELRTPYRWDGRARLFSTQFTAMGDLVWLESPYAEHMFDGPVERRPLTWPHRDRRLFPDWVRGLRDSDAGNLRPFGLPSIAELRTIARAPSVYAYLTSAVDVADLATLAQRGDVKSLRLVDVALPID